MDERWKMGDKGMDSGGSSPTHLYSLHASLRFLVVSSNAGGLNAGQYHQKT